jgi:ketosteroid isomerase-like protein
MIATQKGTFIYALTVALLGFALQSQASTLPSAAAAVYAADDDWVKAYNGGEVDTVVAAYDEHAIVYPPGSPPVQGAAAIRSFYIKDNAEFTKGGLTFVLGAKRSGGVRGDLGWASGTYVIKDKGGKTVDTGWYFSVSRKVAGKWLYVRDSYNSDSPPH